jgi:hypothetical protein
VKDVSAIFITTPCPIYKAGIYVVVSLMLIWYVYCNIQLCLLLPCPPISSKIANEAEKEKKEMRFRADENGLDWDNLIVYLLIKNET